MKLSYNPQNIHDHNYQSNFVSKEDDKANIYLEELRPPKRRKELQIFPWADIEMIKRLMVKRGICGKETKLNDIIIMHKGVALSNTREINPFISDVFTGTSHPPVFEWTFAACESVGIVIRIVDEESTTQRMKYLVNQARTALNRGIFPKLTLEGTAGTYICFDIKRKPIGIIKPRDEEAFAPHNPRGYVGELFSPGFRPGVLSGESSSREVAAFKIDCMYNHFFGVPETCHVELAHPSLSYSASNTNVPNINSTESLTLKNASFQEFVDAESRASDYNPGEFSISSVHKLALLDMTIVNLDRNEANAMVFFGNVEKKKKSSVSKLSPENPSPDIHFGHSEYINSNENMHGKISRLNLIPIDHGLCIPDSLTINREDWCWVDWPQTRIHLSDEELRLVARLNPIRDVSFLGEALNIRASCLRAMRASVEFLKLAVQEGLTLAEIAYLMTRDENIGRKMSALEICVKWSLERSYNYLEATNDLKPHYLMSAGTLSVALGSTWTKSSINLKFPTNGQSTEPLLERGKAEDRFWQTQKEDVDNKTTIASTKRVSYKIVITEKKNRMPRQCPTRPLENLNSIRIKNVALKFSRSTGEPLPEQRIWESDEESHASEEETFYEKTPQNSKPIDRTQSDTAAFLTMKTKFSSNEYQGEESDPLWSFRRKDERVIKKLPWDHEGFQMQFIRNLQLKITSVLKLFESEGCLLRRKCYPQVAELDSETFRRRKEHIKKIFEETSFQTQLFSTLIG
eukprot:GHVP01001425.1.p1 GENE.GHVP01001425.1~~GHVP01001425.1.p1  ORF type:complete len:745 (+),score=123.00 GHVP01001425.1:30-2264(+)